MEKNLKYEEFISHHLTNSQEIQDLEKAECIEYINDYIKENGFTLVKIEYVQPTSNDNECAWRRVKVYFEDNRLNGKKIEL
jgi:hypothetical protein